MGLLDDAIREHLDLKRARGGDPAEIERMEREALGPVRREPTIGSTRLEAAGEHELAEPEFGYPDDRDELLAAGYHDSTAPHAQPHHDHAHGFDDHHDPLAPPPAEAEPPRRRFLRRNRPRSLSDSVLPDPGFHEEAALDPHVPLGYDEAGLEHHEAASFHELAGQHEPLYDESAHHESLAHHDLHEHMEAAAPEHSPGPPHLEFDHPPKRPRFTTEPPELQDQPAAEPVTDTHEAAAAAGSPAPVAPQTGHRADPDVQETTEFDVEQHIAETRFQPDPETPVPPIPETLSADDAPAAPAAPGQPGSEQQEDVLEETPEFLQDTPEHDRLWFEQRPPRDFDFDG